MSEKHVIEPFDQIRFTRTEHGWTFVWAPKDGGMIGRPAEHYDTFVEASEEARKRYGIV